MPDPLARKYTLNDLRAARSRGQKVAMLTCYDHVTARLMAAAGVPMILVGDSLGNVMLGHDTTLPVTLELIIELTRAVRRGAPDSFLVADMPFGSYQASTARGAANALRLVKQTECDCIKLEVGRLHAPLVARLAEAGVAVMAHLGLRPQSVGLMGGYKYQGRTAAEAQRIVDLAVTMEQAGAAALLLEAVPPEVAEAVAAAVAIPLIGCGAGPACDGHVVVTADALGLTTRPPRFVPALADLATPMKQALGAYVEQVANGAYPAPEHQYEMPAEEKRNFSHGKNL
jgi:3-methyl-2-oxobutanoate hydroxymethyltransferase